MREYNVIASTNLQQLVIIINDLISDEWRPIGGIETLTQEGMGGIKQVVYMQAVWR